MFTILDGVYHKVRLICNILDQVFEVYCIYLGIAETGKCPTGNAFCHWCFAEDKNVVLNSCIPKFEGKSMIDFPIFFFHVLQTVAIDAVSYIERVETTLRIDFQYVTVCREYLLRYFAMINVPRLFQLLIIFFIVETVTADAVPEMHIHYSPWCQDCFLVRITERVEDGGNSADTVFNGKFVGSFGHFPNTSA